MAASPVLSFHNLSIKEINRHKLFATIYRNPNLPKLRLSQLLDMSLSTIDSSVKRLLSEGLIVPSGTLESTGGRKATGYTINARHKSAIGVFIRAQSAIICAVDLNGDLIASQEVALPYSQESSYLERLSTEVSAFIGNHSELYSGSVLGISLAIQGIVTIDEDDSRVSYGKILDNQQLTLSALQKHFKLPCTLHHDSKAAAFAALWEHPKLENAALVLLNDNVGGALIFNNTVHYGNAFQGGLIEHLTVDHQGRQCYCGDYDCLECYCSKRALEQEAKLPLTDFFTKLHEPECPEALQQLWQSYLEHLSIAIRQVHKMIDGTIILTGAMAPYLTVGDLTELVALSNEHNAFSLTQSTAVPVAHSPSSAGPHETQVGDLLLSVNGDSIVALGAARYLINAYLECFEANPISDPKCNLGTITLNLPEDKN